MLQAVPHAAIAGLMAVFRRLPQRVVIKLDSEYWREAAPANVMVVPWVPQQAVLAHNNTRLFITHCGMHGESYIGSNLQPKPQQAKTWLVHTWLRIRRLYLLLTLIDRLLASF